MRLFLALLRNVAFTMVLALGTSYFAVSRGFQLQPEQEHALLLALVAGLLFQVALGAVVVRVLSRPVEAALARLDALDEAAARRAALAAHALAPRAALTLFGTGLVVVAGVVAYMTRGGKMPFEQAVAGGAVGLSTALLGGMLIYALCSASVTRIAAPLGARIDEVPRGTVREKILVLGFGLSTVTLLLIAAPGYVRYRMDVDREFTFSAERAIEGALLMPLQAPQDRVKAVSRSCYSPAVLLTATGQAVARSGSSAATLIAAGPPEPGTVRVPGGWMITRPAPDGLFARAFLSEAQLDVRRDAFWKALGVLAAVVYAGTALLVWFASLAITLPFQPLNHAAGKIAAGDLTASPPTLSRDEIGRLAADFRRMAQGLQGLVRDVQSASEGVSSGAREAGAIGEQVKRGALDQHAGVRSVQAAVEAMDGSVSLVSRGLGGLSEYVAATGRAVGEMAEAFDEVQRKGAEMERAMASALAEVETLGSAGREAEGRLADLEALASRAGGSLAEVKASVSGLERAAGETETTAGAVADLSDRAGLVMEETVHGIESLRTAVTDAHARIAALGRRSDDIDQVVDFISEVAGRTNLLSLNASIIASQAGEHGKAFAVVADQIRELASQIARSTKSIGDIIHAVREDVEGTAALIDRGDALSLKGVQLARNSLQALGEIRRSTAHGRETAAAIRGAVEAHAQSSREVSALVESVAEGSRAVAAAVQLVGRSVTAVHSVSRGVTGIADRVARALEEQSGLGRRQLENLSRLEKMISEITAAVENHNAATRRVREALQALSATAGAHEVAVEGLSGVADEMGHKARALSERVNRFKV